MNMTNEVRTAAYTLMQRHLTEPFANDEERRLVLRQADDACEILAAWLDAQDAAEERWEPVKDTEYRLVFNTPDNANYTRIEVLYCDSNQAILDVSLGNIRLCRRVMGAEAPKASHE